jgi:hypothetical protein
MHYNLALALGLSGRDAEAIAELQTLLQLNPGHAGARAALEAARGIR